MLCSLWTCCPLFDGNSSELLSVWHNRTNDCQHLLTANTADRAGMPLLVTDNQMRSDDSSFLAGFLQFIDIAQFWSVT